MRVGYNHRQHPAALKMMEIWQSGVCGSCTEWKNLFSFEVYGRQGKLHWEGLGGSYGVERLTHYRMLPEMGPPDTVIYEYPRGDQSWKLEMDEFFEDIRLHRTPVPGLHEALRALTVVEALYPSLPQHH